MAPSKQRKDTLGLGKHLVRELNLADGVDTLGRWMAHHLAELIHEAERGKTVAGRLKASQQATETILRIWDHRKSLPHDAYPIARYEDLLKVIDRLRIDNNPYKFYGHNFQNRTDQIASALFDNLARLIPTLLLMKINSLSESKKVDPEIIETLDKEEQQLLAAFHEWLTLFPIEENQHESVEKGKKTKTTERFDLSKNALSLTKSLKSLLTTLEKELKAKKSKGR